MALTIGYWISTVIRMFYLCFPFAYTWNRSIEDGSCVNLTAAYLSVALINLALDAIIIALPMPVLWTLQMPTKKKIAISAIFGLGAV